MKKVNEDKVRGFCTIVLYISAKEEIDTFVVDGVETLGAPGG